MIKPITNIIRSFVAVLLIASIITPVQIESASASGTITKTITVLGTDGLPYQGALVELAWYSTTGSASRTSSTTPVVTNASGVAVLTFADNITSGSVYVEPPLTDTATASYSNYDGNLATSDPLTVNLKKADVRVNILAPDGQDAPANGGSENGFGDWFQTVRPGAIGISIPDNAATNVCKTFRIYAPDALPTAFQRPFGIKVTGTGASRSVKIYTDSDTCSTEAPKLNGVYQLTLNTGNVSGRLFSNSGGALSFGATEGYDLLITGRNADGFFDRSMPSGSAFVSNTGEFSIFADTSTVGRYELSFNGFGSYNYPSFVHRYLYVTSDHKLSWNENGSESAGTLTRDFNLPNPNFRLNYIDSSTGTAIAGNIGIRKKLPGGSYDRYLGWNFNEARASFNLPDGEYQVSASGYSSPNGISFKVTVSSGVATVSNDSVPTHNFVNSTYTVWYPAPNIAIRLVDDSGTAITSGAIDFCGEGQNSCAAHGESDSQGLISIYLPDGNFSNTWVNGGNNPEITQMRISASMTGGVLSIDGLSPIDGLYTVVIPRANIKFSVTNPLTNSPFVGGDISFETADSSWQGNGWYGNANVDWQMPGYGRAKLVDGRYLATISVWGGNPENVGLASQTYRITVANGVFTVSLNGTIINPVNGRYPIAPTSANLDLSVQDLAGDPISDGDVLFCTDLGNGDTGPCRGSGINNGQVSQYLTNGNWVAIFRPGSSIPNLAPKTYSISVSGGVPTVSGSTKVNNRWVITGTPPNIRGSFTLQSGSLGAFGNNQGISLDVQKYVNNNWEYQGNGSWVRSSTFAMKVTNPGRYRLVATPRNFSDLVTSYSSEFWIDNSGKIATTQNGTYSDSLTALNIQLKAPNLKLKVVNPADSTLLPGGWITIEKMDGQARYWVGNADISPSTPGLTGANLTEVGQYLLTVNPPNGNGAIVGLASRQYVLTVAANDSMTITSDGTPVTLENGRWVLSPAAANVTARVLMPDGTPFASSNGKWINANLQKFNDGNNNWEWTSVWANGDQDGYVSMRLNEAGKYRLRVQPSGDPDVTVTYSSEFTVASNELNTFKKDFGSITLVGPSIKISVATSGAPSTPLYNSGIEIRKDGNWLDWADTQRSGVAGISLKSEGIYEFIVNPPQDLQGTTARKSYKINAVKNGDGVITATALAGTGVSVNNGVTTLLLGAPTLSGTVLAPTGSTTQPNSQVYAYNVTTGQEMWEYSTNTNNSGAWAMSLPAGTYKIFAKAPWGTSTYGGSDGVGDVIVDANGSVTVPSGMDANAFTIRLKTPTWSGVVKNPAGTAPVPNARVCLRLNNVFNCVNADNNGRWAMSAPANFTNFTSTNPYLELNDDYGRQYPQKRLEGVTAVNGAIGTSGSDIVLQFSDANTQIVVTAGGQPVSNVWVTAERDGVGWLGGGNTNAAGVAKLDIADLTSDLRVRVELNGNPTIASSYATTMKTFALADITGGTSGGVFTGNVALAEPNFKVALFEPTSDGSVGNPVAYSWIELINEATGMWIGGSGTDANGFASFKLDVPQSGTNKFLVNVNPSWNSATNFSRQSYSVTVSSSSTVTVVNKTTTTAVTTSSVNGRTVYPLTLGNPTVTGFVVDPSGNGVANSWVVPIDATTNEYYWQQGTNSRNNGAIGLNLGNGTYKLEANVPWGTSDLAKSAQCSVTVAAGTISTGGACVQVGTPKTVRLALRAPNLTFTLKIEGSVVANANVGIGSGKWFTNAQSDSNGRVSLFVDADAIRTLNNYTTAQPLNVWVDPPYGGTVTMARWDCQSTQAKPICSGLQNVPATGDYPTLALGDVTGVSPNTRVRVVAPGTSTPLPNAWVTVQAFDPAHPEYGTRWLGGGNSNSNGYVSMNLDTSTVQSGWKYLIEINAPWNQRETYATNLDTNSGNGYTWSEITSLSSKSPATPNLTITVNASDASANKFGWIGVEEVNGSNIPQRWVGGYGLNESAITSVYFAASKRFKITAYPGPGKTGARTVCIVSTNASAVVSAVSGQCGSQTVIAGALTIALDGGNIVGVVKNGTTPLVGAIVYANTSDAVDETTAIITSTGADGRYGLQLDPTKTWNIKVFPTGAGSENLSTGSKTGVVPPSTGSATHDFTIAAR
jgi:hypothetical protein